MTMDQINWAILGSGAVAAEFAEGLRALPDAALYAVASRDEARAKAFAHTHGFANAYGSYEACVADPLVRIVYIATPNHRHYDDILLCLKHGKAVLCEKPFVLTPDQGRRIAEAARAANVFCMEGMWMRFIPLVVELRDRVRAGLVGRPVLLTADFGVPTVFDETNRFFNKALGGGALLDRGIYLVSLAFWLFGKPTSVTAQARMASTGVDESASVILNYDNGPLAVLNTSLSARYANTATVFGDRGSITLKDPFYAAEEMTVALHGGPRAPAGGASLKSRLIALVKAAPGAAVLARRLRARVGVKTIVRPHGASAYRYEAAEAMRCVRLGLLESPIMPLGETIDILECLDAIQAALGAPHPDGAPVA